MTDAGHRLRAARLRRPLGRCRRGRRPDRARRLGAGRDVRSVRNGSRGMLWLEPLVEVDTAEGRVAYGPVTPDDVDGCSTPGCSTAATIRSRLGLTDEIAVAAPTSSASPSPGSAWSTRCRLDDYQAHGGLRRPAARAGDRRRREVVDEVTDVRAARPRRRRLPRRHQVADRPRGRRAT